MEIKAIAFDVDGTLYDYRDKKIHNSTIDAIHAAKQKGIYIVLATARSYAELNTICQQEIQADFFIGASGQSILDSERRSLWSERFSFEQTERMLEVSERFDAGLTLKYDTVNCLYSHYDEMEQIFSNIGNSVAQTIRCDRRDYHKKELPIGFSIRGENGIREKIATVLSNYPNDYRFEMFRNGIVADVFLPHVSKFTALNHLAKRLNIKSDEFMTFGDSLNDIEMTKWAGIGVCMGNGRDELKGHADYICENGWEAGIAKTIAKFVL